MDHALKWDGDDGVHKVAGIVGEEKKEGQLNQIAKCSVNPEDIDPALMYGSTIDGIADLVRYAR
jgi:hypothetical protein